MQGSRDKLKDALQDKLLNYEAGVTRETSDAILARVHAAKKPGGMIRKAIYSTGLLVIVGSLYYYTQITNTAIVVRYAAASITSIAADSKALTSNEKPPDATSQVIVEREAGTSQAAGTAPAPNAALEVISNGSESITPSTKLSPATGPLLLSPSIDRSLESIRESQSPAESTVMEKPEQLTSELVAEPIAPENSIDQGRRFSLSLGLMPTLNYKRLVPNGSDAAYLHDFNVPSSLDKNRFGFTTSLLAHYALKKERSIYAGMGFFTYQSQFTYNSSEVASSVSAVNDVDETLQGVSVLAGLRLPLWPHKANRYNLTLGGQLQFPKSGPQFVAQAGVEYGVQLSRGLLIIQPTVFYSVTPIHYSGLIAYPYGGGFDLRYELPLGFRD